MLRALSSFHAHGRFVADGELVDPKDPIVAGREALFADDGTAEPAEKAAPRKAPARRRSSKD